MLILKIISLVFIINCVSGAFYSNYEIDAKKYFAMPHLNEFDDYEECMDVYQNDAKYCYVKSLIKPDHQSQLYLDIAEFSSRKKQHFRHDKLTRGICINNCMKLIEKLGGDAEEYYEPDFDGSGSKLTFSFINFSNYAEDQKAYDKIINQCINFKLRNSHNLTAFSSLEYCKRNHYMFEIDRLDIAFVCLVIGLLTIVILSSNYDARLRTSYQKSTGVQIKPDEHYKQQPSSILQQFLVSFSVYRNWYLLSAPPKDDMRDLRAISAVRIWTMIAIVYGHSTWFSIAMPLQNPIWAEKNYHLIDSMIVINGGNIVQTFFFISGFLNSISLLSYVDKNRVKNFFLFIKVVIYRIIKFVPVMMFLAFLHSTWLHRFDHGPYWDRFTAYERQACRQNMWTNSLLINNYVSGNMRCMIHSWYLAADFQLSVIGAGLLLLIVNYPKKRNILLFGSIIISFIIAFIHFYINKLEPILMAPPENVRNQFIGNEEYDKYFYKFHTPTHLNTGNYLIGLVIGYFYYQYKQANVLVNHRRTFLLNILWHWSYIMTYVLCFIGIYFYEYDIKLGVISSILGAFLKHVYGLVIGILLVGIFLRYGWIIPKMFNYGMYRILGRMSFCVYLVHFTIGNLIIMKNKFPIEVNNSMLCAFTYSIYFISHTAALFLILCIELPAHVIYKVIVNEVLDKPKKNEIVKDTKNGIFKVENELSNTKL